MSAAGKHSQPYPWEQVELNDIAPVTMGQSPNSKNYTENPNNYILVQGNADLFNGQVLPRIYTTQVTKVAHVGDILMSVRAPVGNIAQTQYDVVIGRGVAAISGNLFIKQLLNKMDKAGYWNKYIAGSTFESVNSNDIKSANIKVPKLEEQKKIGQLFQSLDKTITLHEEKQRQLEQLKKALLQKMFADETGYPALRFKNFTEKWEQRKFSDIYKKSSEKNDLSFSKDKVISVANNKWGTAPKNSTDKYMRTYYVYRIGDIAFEGNKSKKFKFGRFVENTLANGIVSHVFDIYRPTQKEHDLWFWKYYIHNENIMRDVLRKSTTKATMMTNLVNKDLLKQKLNIPSIEEQEKIGNYLSKLDHLITLHQHKIDNLKRLKRALLQKMFV